VARTVNFHNSVAAAATVLWTADADCEVTGYIGGVGAVISKDPANTVATWFTTPAGQYVDDNWSTGFSSGATISVLALPISAGEKIYCAFTGKGTVTIYVRDVS
jgi:hypothetical protein